MLAASPQSQIVFFVLQQVCYIFLFIFNFACQAFSTGGCLYALLFCFEDFVLSDLSVGSDWSGEPAKSSGSVESKQLSSIG